MKTVSRIDKAQISGKLTKTPQGFLRGDAVVARTGVLEYFENGAVVKELVLPEELSNRDSLETLKMIPVTNGHPSVKMLDAKTVKQFQCGHTGQDAKVDGGLLHIPITIADIDAVKDVEDNNKRELSAGYNCEPEENPGVWNGQRYDRIQRNRQYNHVAICDLSRAGDVTTMHLDSSEVYECGTPDYNVRNDSLDNHNQRSDRMVKINLDGIDYECAPEVKNRFDKLVADAAKAATEHKTALDSMTAERDNFKDKFTKADADLKAMPDKIKAATDSRIDLVAAATPHLDEETVKKIGTMSDKEIKTAIVMKAYPKADLKDASDVYLQGRFDSALETLGTKKADNAMDDQYRSANGAHSDAKGKDGDDDEEKRVDCDAARAANRKKGNRDSVMGTH